MIKVGTYVKVDTNKLIDKTPAYVSLVKKILKNGEGSAYVSKLEGNYVYLRSHENDFLGDVRVPTQAIKANVRSKMQDNITTEQKLYKFLSINS